MRDQILALLIAKFTGISEQVLSRIADKLAKTATTTEQATTVVEGTTLQTVIDSYADSRSTEAIATGIADYEKKHNVKDGKVIGGEPTIEPIITPDDNRTPPWAKALIDSTKALNERIDTIEGAKVTDSRKQRFDAVIANLPDNLKKSYQRTGIDTLTDEEFETLTTEVTAEVGVIEADIKAKGSIFQRPLGGGGDQQIVSQNVKDRIEVRKKEHVPTVIQGLPEEQ